MAKNSGEEKDDSEKKGGALKLVLGAVLLLGTGAGGVFGAMAAGLIGPAPEADEPTGPALVLKGNEDPFAPADDDKDKSKAEIVHGEGGSKYRTAYFRFEDGFTSNLADSGGLIQVNLAASTSRDGRILQWLEQHELAVRSAILIELAATTEEDAFSIDGKERLQERLAKAIDKVLVEKEGFGGIDEVYFESLLVQ